MNKENLQKLIDFLRELPEERISMGSWTRDRNTNKLVMAKTLMHDCNTTGCIAGWTCALLLKKNIKRFFYDTAKELLSLSDGDAHDLFVGYPITAYCVPPSKQNILRTLEHLLATGEVDWDI